MDTPKLLLADQSAAFCAAVADAMAGACDLQICHDGQQARALLKSFHPDVVVIDLTLPVLDGIAVLKDARNQGIRPMILVTTSFCSAFVENAVRELGVDYMVLKPCNASIVAERIRDMVCRGKDVVRTMPQKGNTVDNMLLSLSLSTKHAGFRFLEDAVVLYEQNSAQSVTKILYPEIGKRYNCSGYAVERAIRNAIQKGWENRDERAWRMYFNQYKNGQLVRPTNTVFIGTLADALRRQQDRGQVG